MRSYQQQVGIQCCLCSQHYVSEKRSAQSGPISSRLRCHGQVCQAVSKQALCSMPQRVTRCPSRLPADQSYSPWRLLLLPALTPPDPELAALICTTHESRQAYSCACAGEGERKGAGGQAHEVRPQAGDRRHRQPPGALGAARGGVRFLMQLLWLLTGSSASCGAAPSLASLSCTLQRGRVLALERQRRHI